MFCRLQVDVPDGHAVWRAVQTAAAFGRSIWEVDEERGCRWRMDCEVDHCQHAQSGEKGYDTQT